jgi:MFS family permease
MSDNTNNKNRQQMKTLYVLLITQAVSMVGSRMTSVGIGIWLYQMTGRETDLLLMPFFNELPGLLLSHYFGAIVDRFSRKKVIILSDMGQAVSTVLLMAMVLSGDVHLMLLYLAVFIQGTFGALQSPASDAVISQLIVDEHRDRVNGIKEMTFPVSGMLAPALAGIMLLQFGIKSVLIVDFLTFLAAVASVSNMTFPAFEPLPSDEGETLWRQSFEGFKFLKQSKALLVMVIYVALVNILLNGPLELIVPLVMTRLKAPEHVGWMLSLMSIATFSGALLASVNKLKIPRHYVLIGAVIISGTGMAGLSFQQHIVGAAVMLVLTMLPLPMINVAFKAILQIKTPTALQGRVFGTVFQLAYGLATVSFVITGPLLDQWVEPAMQGQMLGAFNQWFGYEAGAGIAVVLFVTGILLVMISIGALLVKGFKAS